MKKYKKIFDFYATKSEVPTIIVMKSVYSANAETVVGISEEANAAT